MDVVHSGLHYGYDADICVAIWEHCHYFTLNFILDSI